MIPLFSLIELKNASQKDMFPLKCVYCSSTFYKSKRRIKIFLNPNQPNRGDFCSPKCASYHTRLEIGHHLKEEVICKNCSKLFSKDGNRIKLNNFCSKSCAATFNNKNKITGTRRSKLEMFLENELIKMFPYLEFRFNKKDTINSELDIYIPALKLAFELNGIFHYEPIYGPKKLLQIQNNDNRKFQACLERGIELCIIDTSKQIYFKEKTSEKFLEIISKIIEVRVQGIEP